VQIFGFDITRRKNKGMGALVPHTGWFPWIKEPYTGAWQKNDSWTTETVLAFHAVFACITLISQDVGKLRIKLMRKQGKVWEEIENPAFSPVLRKPNRYQNHIQFKEWWMLSKLTRGNTYVLKRRDGRGVVNALYLLDPTRVRVLVAPDGSVYYEVPADNLTGITEDSVSIPASEIIHDRMNCLWHPLVGVSPIFASGSAALIGLNIEKNSSAFFGNGSNPGGILTAPGSIKQETADRLKAHWEENYGGENAGKVAVLGDGLKFEAMRMTAVDSQLIQQLKWAADVVCSTFHVPPFKIGIGATPTYQSAEILNQIYYADCLQSHIESMEAVLDEGLGITQVVGEHYGVELDLEGLLRMDTNTQIKTLGEGVKGAIMTPNEARQKIDLSPLTGGDTVYMQQQNYSLAALDARDKENPLTTEPPPALPAPDEERAWREKAMATLALELS
jgi:HK97 family phage portal protein